MKSARTLGRAHVSGIFENFWSTQFKIPVFCVVFCVVTVRKNIGVLKLKENESLI